MEIYYENHNGVKIDFMSNGYNVEESEFFSHSWDYETKKRTFGAIIESFKKDLLKTSFSVHIEDCGLTTCEKAYETLLSTVDVDIIKKKCGRLYVNGYYLECYIVENKPKYFVPNLCCIACELNVISEYPFWIKEQKYTFQNSDTVENLDNKRYFGRYPYRYVNGMQNMYIVNSHFSDANFKLVICGPALNPQVTIGGNRYLINIDLEEGELLEVDSRARTITRVYSNGAKESAYHNREKGTIFFSKIPSGRQMVSWNGQFVFDLTIIEERSEPKWSV